MNDETTSQAPPLTPEEQAAQQEAYRRKTVLRLYDKISYSGDCWLWKGSLRKDGYGSVVYKGRLSLAHRVSFSVFYSAFNPELDVLHKCDNPACINPLHLYLGTHLDNMRDRKLRNRGNQPKGSKRVNAKLTEDKVVAIKRDTRTHKAIAFSYGVDETLISQIKRGIIWKHVTT